MNGSQPDPPAVADRLGLADRRLYLCCPDRPDLESFLEEVILGGVDIVQLRDKFLPAREVLERAGKAAQICRDMGVPFILNDRPDLAAWLAVDGVHVGQDDAPVELARQLVGDDRLVGLSTHAPAELAASEQLPVDYVSVGPIESTPTKPGRPPTGPEYVRLAARVCSRPFFLTGGVTPEKIPDLKRLGAERFVVVRYLTESTTPRKAAARLRQAIDA